MPIANHRGLWMGICSSWNWKCALMSAVVRSLIYVAAMIHRGAGAAGAVALVEIGYVTLTAGIYAGLQQRALRIRSRLAGNAVIVAGVPMLGQALDWLAHRLSGPPVALRAIAAVSVFTLISALFHLYAMRNGVFLTGQGRSLADDFRRIPRLLAGFVAMPFAAIVARLARETESEAAL